MFNKATFFSVLIVATAASSVANTRPAAWAAYNSHDVHIGTHAGEARQRLSESLLYFPTNNIREDRNLEVPSPGEARQLNSPWTFQRRNFRQDRNLNAQQTSFPPPEVRSGGLHNGGYLRGSDHTDVARRLCQKSRQPFLNNGC